MFKSLRVVSLFCVMAALSSSFAQAQDVESAVAFKEGVHYTVLPVEKSSTPQVTKFFSFFCGACYNIEPVMQWLEPKLPAEVAVQKIHVDFVRGASPEVMGFMSKGALLAKALNVGPAYHNAVFRQIHVAKTPFRSEKDVQLALIAAGVDEEKAASGLKSFSVNGQYAAGEKKLKHYVGDRMIRGVPTLIVNDKYRIAHSELDPKQFEQQLLQLTQYLLTL